MQNGVMKLLASESGLGPGRLAVLPGETTWRLWKLSCKLGIMRGGP